MQFYYFGESNVLIEAFNSYSYAPGNLMVTFDNSMSGDLLTINDITSLLTDGILPKRTYFRITKPSGEICYARVYTQCPVGSLPGQQEGQETLGKTFGNFTVFSHTDKGSGMLCTLENIRREWHMGGNVVALNADTTNRAFGTKNYEDLAFMTNDSVRMTITKDGDLLMRSLNVTDDVSDGGFLATFENTNGGAGDGLKIKLGKKATKNGSGFVAVDFALATFVGEGFGPDKASDIKNLFDGDIDGDDTQFLASMLVPDADQALGLAATLCVLTEEVTNFIFMEIDTLFDSSPVPYLGTIDLPCDFIGDAWDFPTLDFNDQANTLDGENTFIEFTDNTDWKMGAIKAQSIDEWAGQYLSAIFLYDLYSTFKGLDKSSILPEVKAKTKEVAQSYLNIGVEYSSGNGDYAEWLERLDPKEAITTGDIVAVKGGKITKDLTDAEQVMAVSHRPIVLGNIPPDGKNHLGNNIAFMGQIPVKIMGAVATGDYIVGKSKIAGYGIAISPEDMTIEDFKLAVGRSWEANPNSGPKMVNTVIGVHNGDYLNILKRYEQKFKDSEARLESVEAKVEMLSELMTKENKSN
jgi:hypothetical protein